MVEPVLKEKKDYSLKESEWISEPIRRTISEVEEEVKEIVEENASDTSGAAGRSVMPEIKGLDILREGIYSSDLEKTISDMYSTIRNMEIQLERVLNINTHLEKDLKASREMIGLLKTEKSQLEKTIAQLENEIPSKRELQIELDHLVEERNVAQGNIREMKLKLGTVQKTVLHLQERVARVEEEKRDAITEINYLESRLKAATEKIKRYESELTVLRGEKLVQAEKIRCVEQELSELLNEKYKLLKDLKEAKDALEEIGSTLVESKLQAKKSFYKAAGTEE
jgi:chromosome segregation ATPase